MDDKQILNLYFERSEQAISETAVKYGNYCYYIAFSILRNVEDAEECVNEAYMKLWSLIPPNEPQNLKTYLGKLVRNLSLKLYEKQNAKKRCSDNSKVCIDELDLCVQAQNVTDEIVIRQILDKFLLSLSDEMRNVFIRRYWYMNTVEEIAKGYRISESKVTVLLFRARKKLRALLEKEGINL